MAGAVVHQSRGVLVHTNEAGMLIIEISEREQGLELKQALHRALNTWDRPPAWLMATADKLEKLK